MSASTSLAGRSFHIKKRPLDGVLHGPHPDFAAAFAYLDGAQKDEKIVCADWALLDGLNELIDTNKLGAPVKFDFKAGCG